MSSENKCVVVFNYHGSDEGMKGFVGYYDVFDTGIFHNGRLNRYFLTIKNFKANTKCGGDISIESEGYIKSPYFSNYPMGIECIWILIVPEGKSIYLHFDSFKVFTICYL